MARVASILFGVLTALNVLLSGSAGGGVVCLGGGHEHEPREVEPCGLAACAHEAGVLSRRSDHEHEHCDCTDVPISGPAVVVLARSDERSLGEGLVPSPEDRPVCAAGDGAESTGPPTAPPWFDPGGEHRLAVVASVRLII